MQVPQAVADALSGRPEVGASESVFLLLTTGRDGGVHVTLLSRAELETEGPRVHIALAGSVTPENLARDGRATLFLVSGTTAYSCELREERRVTLEGMVGISTLLVGCREDSLGIPLHPPSFEVPASLPGVERWDRSAEALARLAAS